MKTELGRLPANERRMIGPGRTPSQYPLPTPEFGRTFEELPYGDLRYSQEPGLLRRATFRRQAHSMFATNLLRSQVGSHTRKDPHVESLTQNADPFISLVRSVVCAGRLAETTINGLDLRRVEYKTHPATPSGKPA